MRSMAEQVLGILTARKRMYAMRRPGIIAMVSLSSVQRLLETGVAGGIQVSDRVRRICRDVAVTEVENMAALMEAEPMGLQFGLLTGAEPSSAFKILRARDRVSLAINPFRPDTHPSAHTGVAMITGADEAIAAHQRVAEASWREAVKGAGRREPAAAAGRDARCPPDSRGGRCGAASLCWRAWRPAAFPLFPRTRTSRSVPSSASGTAASRSTSCASAIAASTAPCPASEDLGGVAARPCGGGAAVRSGGRRGGADRAVPAAGTGRRPRPGAGGTARRPLRRWRDARGDRAARDDRGDGADGRRAAADRRLPADPGRRGRGVRTLCRPRAGAGCRRRRHRRPCRHGGRARGHPRAGLARGPRDRRRRWTGG